MKRKLALLLALVVALGIALSGCTPSGTTPTTAGTTTTAPAQQSATPGATDDGTADEFTYPMEPVTLTINMAPLDYSTVPEWAKEYYAWDLLEERTGVKLDRIGSAANAIDMSDEFLLLLASGDYPDLLQCAWASGFPGGPAAAISDGYIILLDDYTEYFPRLMGYLEENPAVNTAFRNDEGNIYCFPKVNLEEVGTGPVVRQDWLDQLNLDVPETVEDWYNVLTAFKTEMNVNAPLTFEARWLFLEYAASSLSSPWGVTYPFYIMNDEVVFGPLEENYPLFLAEMAKWYKEGLIDPDLASVDKNTVQAKFATGESGIAIQQLGNVANCFDANKDDAAYDITALKAMVMNEGDVPQFSRWVRQFDGGHSIGISTQCDKIETACRYLDYLYGDDGLIFGNYGTEGVSYNIVDGEYQWTDLVLNNPDTPNPGTALGFMIISANHTRPNLPGKPPTQPEHVMAIYDGWVCNMGQYVYPTVTHTLEESSEVTSLYNSIDTYCREMILKYILGTEDLSTYDNFINTIKGMGIDRVLEIKRDAYQRYINR